MYFKYLYTYKSHCVCRNADLHPPHVFMGPSHLRPNGPLHCHAPSLFPQRLNSSFLELTHAQKNPNPYCVQTALSGSQGTSNAFSHVLYQRGLSRHALVPYISKGEASLQRQQPHFVPSSPVCASNTWLLLVQNLTLVVFFCF